VVDVARSGNFAGDSAREGDLAQGITLEAQSRGRLSEKKD
jgi:hypothetical protein